MHRRARKPFSRQADCRSADVPGNLALALSVDSRAISIANLGDYSDTTLYIGYFDPAKCYVYRYNTTTPSSSHFRPPATLSCRGAPRLLAITRVVEAAVS